MELKSHAQFFYKRRIIYTLKLNYCIIIKNGKMSDEFFNILTGRRPVQKRSLL